MSEESKSVNQTIIAIMREVGAIGKERKNAQQGYNFRGIDDAMNALHGLFAKHGLFSTSEVIKQTREERATKNGGVLIYTILNMRYTFHALDGSTVQTELIGEGMDSGDKSSNKSLAVSLKYALLQMFMIPTRELIDPENDNPEPSPRKLAPTQPLPEGSYQNVKPVDQYVAKPEDAMITKWQDKVYKGKNKAISGKRLGDMPETILDEMHKVYADRDCSGNKEEALLKTALLMRFSGKASKAPSLKDKLIAEKIDPEALGEALHKAGMVDSKNALDFSEKEQKFVLENWTACTQTLKDHLDNIPS